MLYFGRYAPLSKNKSSLFFKYIDLFLERIIISNGYKEFSAPINYTNLLITLPYMKKLTLNSGFTVLSSTISRRNVPVGTKNYGGQHGIILKK
jgi:hypothetical protein